jgi:hypothetical protein
MAPKLFTGLWKVALGLLETSLAGYELPPNEFETASAASSLVLPPRTGMLRASVGIVVVVVGEEREGERGRKEGWLRESEEVKRRIDSNGIIYKWYDVGRGQSHTVIQSWHGKVSRHLPTPPMAQPRRRHPLKPHHRTTKCALTTRPTLCDYSTMMAAPVF